MIDISYKLSELVLKNAEVDSFLDEELSEKKLIDDLGYDSINIIALITDIEETFGIRFNDDTDMIDALQDKKRKQTL